MEYTCDIYNETCVGYCKASNISISLEKCIHKIHKPNTLDEIMQHIKEISKYF